jgi:Mg2+-importing ATPase
MTVASIPIVKKLFGTSDESGSAPATGQSDRELLEICTLSQDALMARFGASEKGLEPAQVDERRIRYGLNEVARRQRLGFVAEILQRFKNPLVVQLLVIAGVSYAMGDLRAAAVVGFMILLSVFLGYFQETRSSKAVDKLRAMVQTTCTVVRGGKEAEIPMSELVPGDLVVLTAGSIIPADLRLLAAKDFFVSQSALTGESLPLEKNAQPPTTVGKTALELPNACFQGSNVLSGSARGLVVYTGSRTYFGSISQKLARQRVLTSFDRGVNAFTWLMIRFMVVMVAITFVILGVVKHNWVEGLLFGLAIAVGLTPEMLPMIVTVNLSKGALAMSRKKVIVKRLNSIQNFGAMDVLCTDKTGTLTQDRIILKRCLNIRGEDSERVLHYAYLNSHFQSGLKNLLDVAVLEHVDLHQDPGHRQRLQEDRRNPVRFLPPAPLGRSRA